MKQAIINPEVELKIQRVIKNVENLVEDHLNVRTEDIYDLLEKTLKELYPVLPELAEYRLVKNADIGLEDFGGHPMRIYTKPCLTKLRFIKACCENYLTSHKLKNATNKPVQVDGWKPTHVIGIVGIIITIIIFIVKEYGDYKYNSGLVERDNQYKNVSVTKDAMDSKVDDTKYEGDSIENYIVIFKP